MAQYFSIRVQNYVQIQFFYYSKILLELLKTTEVLFAEGKKSLYEKIENVLNRKCMINVS